MLRQTKMPLKVPFKLPARSNQALKMSGDKEPVHVYCRLRPLERDTEKPCIAIVNGTTVKVLARKAKGFRKIFRQPVKVLGSDLFYSHISPHSDSFCFSFTGNQVHLHWSV